MRFRWQDRARVAHLHTNRAVTIAYLQARVADDDWHGVSDAANDLREIDAELRALRGEREDGR